jgi:DNA-binding transcriptional ArsR family regulator
MLCGMTSLIAVTDRTADAVRSNAVGLEADSDVIGLEPADWPTAAFGPLVPESLDALDLATILHALSDPLRLRIVAQLADGSEHTCGSFGLPIAKSTCSHHFRVLREAGVVSQRIDGKCRLNRLRSEQLNERFPGLLAAVLQVSEA